ncbi:MAG TPA: hypothetical protein VD707_02315 [Gemmatimonadales bacterium]|jgi:hypothetical protein|nr:hypothetical protein [Gemmatimonadales bacterium]
MESYPLLDVKRHLVIVVGGLTVLLDTGSPASIGRRGLLRLAGRTWEPASDSPVLAQISAWLGRQVDWLVGVDILATMPVLVDGPGRRVTFGAKSNERGGVKLALELRYAVPEVTIRHGEAAAEAFLDTGAPVSYAAPGAVQGRRPDSSETDFYPLVGPFTTPLYQLDVSVGGRSFSGRFGVLPAQLASVLQLIGERWILGSDYFWNRRLLLDLGAKLAFDLT